MNTLRLQDDDDYSDEKIAEKDKVPETKPSKKKKASSYVDYLGRFFNFFA